MRNGNILKKRVREIHVKRICVNQGVGVVCLALESVGIRKCLTTEIDSWLNMYHSEKVFLQNVLWLKESKKCLVSFLQHWKVRAESFLQLWKFLPAESFSRQKVYLSETNGWCRYTCIFYTSWHHSSFWSYTYEQTLAKHLPSKRAK